MKIAVLLLYYRQARYVKECLDSLLLQTHTNHDIFFIDNHSDDGVLSSVREQYPQVKVFTQDTNAGFAKTYNIFLKKCFADGYDACLVMNVDTKADPRLLSELISTYSRAQQNGVKIGLIQPVVLLMREPDKINTIGNAIHWTGMGYCPDYKKSALIVPSSDTVIKSVSGCCMFVSRDYFMNVGGFDERFFMYMEDQEYSMRGTRGGYTHFLSVKARVWHDYVFKLSVSKVRNLIYGLFYVNSNLKS